MLYVYLLCSVITMSCFGAAEQVNNKEELELWPEIALEHPLLEQLYHDSKKRYGNPDRGLYRPIRIKNIQQRAEQLNALKNMKSDLITNANICKALDGGEAVACEIMHHVSFLQFSIYEAESGLKETGFKVSPRIYQFWNAIREQNKPKQSHDEPEPSSDRYKKASGLYKGCIQNFKQYEEIKRELLKLANEAIDANEDRTAASIMQFINDLESRQDSYKGAADHTPRTQEVVDRLKQKGVKKISRLDLNGITNQI